MSSQSADKEKASSCLKLIGFLALGCIVLYFLIRPGRDQVPPTEVPISDLTYSQFKSMKDGMTSTQLEQFASQQRIRIQWSGVIDDIKVDIGGSNNVWIDMDGDGWNDLVFEYPLEQSLRYSRGQRITFRADLTGDTVLGGPVLLKDVEILP